MQKVCRASVGLLGSTGAGSARFWAPMISHNIEVAAEVDIAVAVAVDISVDVDVDLDLDLVEGFVEDDSIVMMLFCHRWHEDAKHICDHMHVHSFLSNSLKTR